MVPELRTANMAGVPFQVRAPRAQWKIKEQNQGRLADVAAELQPMGTRRANGDRQKGRPNPVVGQPENGSLRDRLRPRDLSRGLWELEN